jgi:hypothetical protein
MREDEGVRYWGYTAAARIFRERDATFGSEPDVPVAWLSPSGVKSWDEKGEGVGNPNLDSCGA